MTTEIPAISLPRKFLFGLIAVILFLMAADWAAAPFIEEQFMLQLGGMSAGRTEDRYLFWRLQGKFSDETLGIYTNSLGFRDREFSHDVAPGVMRIACLGDSVTFGWKIPQEFTYPDILEDYLNGCRGKDDPRVEVLNMGIPGYSSMQGRVLVERELGKYSPDIIVFSFGINDSQGSVISDAENYHRNTGRWYGFRAKLEKSHLYRLIKQNWIRRVKPADKRRARERYQRVSVPEFERNLRQVILQARDMNARLVFLSQANTGRNNLLQPYFDIEKKLARSEPEVYYCDAIDLLVSFDPEPVMDYMKKLNERWPDSGVSSGDFFGTPLTTPRAERFRHLMVDPVHPNIVGNAVLGIQLARFLLENVLIG
ncbi:SGNH/GDSL hydrolase family protein [bacterium]|nr:SGNH/GDSL hydrolase family protein [candidate division CSSED10-310 bacterium]